MGITEKQALDVIDGMIAEVVQKCRNRIESINIKYYDPERYYILGACELAFNLGLISYEDACSLSTLDIPYLIANL